MPCNGPTGSSVAAVSSEATAVARGHAGTVGSPVIIMRIFKTSRVVEPEDDVEPEEAARPAGEYPTGL